MNKRRLKKILLWTGCSMVVLIIVAYFAMNYAVSYVLNSVVSASLSESGKGLADPKKESSSTVPKSQEGVSQDSDTNSLSSTSTPEPSVSPHPSDPAVQDVVKADGNSSEKQPAPSNNAKPKKITYAAEISADKAKLVDEQISLKEKTTVASIILKKFSASDLKLFGQLAAGGLTVEEKKEAKKIFLKKLTEGEYNQLIAIAAKNGLSEGKDYQDSLKEEP